MNCVVCQEKMSSKYNTAWVNGDFHFCRKTDHSYYYVNSNSFSIFLHDLYHNKILKEGSNGGFCLYLNYKQIPNSSSCTPEEAWKFLKLKAFL